MSEQNVAHPAFLSIVNLALRTAEELHSHRCNNML